MALSAHAVFGWLAVVSFQGDPSPMFRGDPAHSGVSRATLFAGQGGVRWRVETGGAVRSSPAVTADRVFVGSGDGSLYAIDRKSGRIVWRHDANSPVHGSPAVAGRLVVAATASGRIFAVDAATGRPRWSLATGPMLPPNTFPAGSWDVYVSSPVVVGRTVFIGSQDGGIYALDLGTGKQIWKAQTGGRVRATPAVHDGLVVTGSWDGRIYALDLETGRERWTHHTIGDTLDSKKFGFDRRAVQSSAAIGGGMVFVGSRDGGLYGIDLATGSRRWRATHRGSWVVGSPAVKDGRVYVGSSDGHFVHAVEAATGEEIWRRPLDSNVLSSPLLIGDLLVVGTFRTNAPTGELLALDVTSGAIRWRLRLDPSVLSSPVAADGELYVGTDDGAVVAIHQVNPAIPRVAVYYDSVLARRAVAPGGRLVFEYFRERGYQHLSADSLGPFLTARITDGAPSAVVFAIDALPEAVGASASDPSLFRRYLDSGGKVVWLGTPPGAAVHDSTGQVVGMSFTRSEGLTGVSTATMDFDIYVGTPTAAGRRWGIENRLRGNFPVGQGAVTEPLSLDEQGRTTAWVRRYRSDRPWAGLVQLWGLGVTAELLPVVRQVAEYGLLR